jgi:hypothetical protein
MAEPRSVRVASEHFNHDRIILKNIPDYLVSSGGPSWEIAFDRIALIDKDRREVRSRRGQVLPFGPSLTYWNRGDFSEHEPFEPIQSPIESWLLRFDMSGEAEARVAWAELKALQFLEPEQDKKELPA